jgi:hypothetical protein
MRFRYFLVTFLGIAISFILYLFILNLYHQFFIFPIQEGLKQSWHPVDRCEASKKISSATQVSSPWYNTVTPSEAFDSGRSHVFPSTCSIEELVGNSPPKLALRSLGGFPGIYNLVTRNSDELFVLGGTQSSDTCNELEFNRKHCSFGPYVAKINAQTMKEEWRTQLHNTQNDTEWDYPGAMGVHRNGKVYIVVGYHAYLIDPKSGHVDKKVTLPTTQDRKPGDTTYNGFTLLSNGDLIAKSLTRKKDSKKDSIQALLMDFDDIVPSHLVILSPDLVIKNTTMFTQPVLGRITNGIFDGQEYIYASGAKDLMRLKVQDSKIILDQSWGPVPYVQEGESPATAPAMFGDFVVVQSNFQYSRKPLVITVVSQKDATKVNRISPFSDDLGLLGSMQWSLPSVDIANHRIYTDDVLTGSLAAIDFDENLGLKVAWKHNQAALSFSALLGTSEKRELVLESAIWGSLSKVNLVWRDAKTGLEKLRSPLLSQGIGLPLTPGFDGVLYYPSHDGTLNELTVQ